MMTIDEKSSCAEIDLDKAIADFKIPDDFDLPDIDFDLSGLDFEIPDLDLIVADDLNFETSDLELIIERACSNWPT